MVTFKLHISLPDVFEFCKRAGWMTSGGFKGIVGDAQVQIYLYNFSDGQKKVKHANLKLL